MSNILGQIGLESSKNFKVSRSKNKGKEEGKIKGGILYLSAVEAS